MPALRRTSDRAPSACVQLVLVHLLAGRRPMSGVLVYEHLRAGGHPIDRARSLHSRRDPNYSRRLWTVASAVTRCRRPWSTVHSLASRILFWRPPARPAPLHCPRPDGRLAIVLAWRAYTCRHAGIGYSRPALSTMLESGGDYHQEPAGHSPSDLAATVRAVPECGTRADFRWKWSARDMRPAVWSCRD